MAKGKKVEAGLLPRLILGISVPILLAFLIIGNMLFFTTTLGRFQLKSIKDIGYESLREVSVAALRESTTALNKLGERMIQEKAADVANEIEIFMRSMPRSKTGNPVFRNPQLKEIAVQKVGSTGYTAVHDSTGLVYFHSNPQMEGAVLSVAAAKLPQFLKIIDTGLKGPAAGYYDWKDQDGKIRPKYMYTVPVKGTNLIVAATTYIDEFSKPVKAVEQKIRQIEQTYTAQYENRFRVFYVIVFLDLVILLMVIYLYSFSVIRPLRQLSEIADKISMGDLKTSINVKAHGEVKVLAESIERMQMSVKAAIERLQRRRG